MVDKSPVGWKVVEEQMSNSFDRDLFDKRKNRAAEKGKIKINKSEERKISL